jgi:hypothetical protein
VNLELRPILYFNIEILYRPCLKASARMYCKATYCRETVLSSRMLGCLLGRYGGGGGSRTRGRRGGSKYLVRRGMGTGSSGGRGRGGGELRRLI